MSSVSATKDGLRATLRELLGLHGVSGFEQPLVNYFRRRVADLAADVAVDRYGNVRPPAGTTGQALGAPGPCASATSTIASM